jgi:hypothetical protein
MLVNVLADSIIMTMRSLPTNIYSVAAVRETDRTTIEDHGVPGYTLMSRAGEAALLGQQIDGKSSVAPAITAATVTSSRASRRRKVPLFQF